MPPPKDDPSNALDELLGAMDQEATDTIGGFHRLEPVDWSLRRYAEEVRHLDGAPMSLARDPFMWQIYADEAREVVIRKSAQARVSEFGITWSLHAVDVLRRNVGYFFPNFAQLESYADERFKTRAIQASPRLDALARAGGASLKKIRLWDRYLYLKGAYDRTQVISTALDRFVADEVDEMDQRNFRAIYERLEGSDDRHRLLYSTPTIPDYGISKAFEAGCQFHWHLQCDRCDHWNRLHWFDNVVLEGPRAGQVVCARCEATLDRMRPGQWIADYPDREVHSYQVERLFVASAEVGALVRTWNSGKHRDEFYYSTLGRPYVPAGSQISLAMLEACPTYDPATYRPTGMTVLGADIGSLCDFRVSEICQDGYKRFLDSGAVHDFRELGQKMTEWNVQRAVIDKFPETKAARQFAHDFAGRVWMCTYPGSPPKAANEYGIVWDDDAYECKVDRTESLDRVADRISNRKLIYPVGLTTDPRYERYVEQIQASVRIRKAQMDDRGLVDENRVRYVWVETRPDHQHHAENYDELAASRLECEPSFTWGIIDRSGGGTRLGKLDTTRLDPQERVKQYKQAIIVAIDRLTE